MDDGRVRNDPTPEARAVAAADKVAISKRFELKFKKPEYFLGSNIDKHADGSVTLRSETYVNSMAGRYLPKPVEEYPKAWSNTPADKTLLKVVVRI